MRKKSPALLTSIFFMVSLLILSALAGCGAGAAPGTPPTGQTPAATTPAGTDTPATPDAPETPPPAGAATVAFVDSAGREVEVPAQITRVSPSGALAQMFIQALAPDLLVSIAGDFSAAAEPYIAENLRQLPVVGQFYGTDNLNIEEIASIGPELVIDIGEPKSSIVEDMDSITDALAIPAVHITATLATTGDAFRALGELLGREAAAERIAAFCDTAYADALAIMAQVGEDNKVPLLYLLGDGGLNVIAATSFHAELIDLIADNIAKVDSPSSRGTGNEVDLEQLLLWDPEVIIFGPDSIYDTVAADTVWQQMKAIQNGAYYEIPLGPYNWMGIPPSVNRFLGMLWLPKLLYPEYANYDLYEKAAEYYKLFYDFDLSRDNYDQLTAKALPAGQR
ncbi:MAG: ABC transporter substrate-binding protein [Peptococcaceae bacterium]|nr:ABC transporter substrate-binding protein [Peptococcaceae bacterium]